MFRTVRNLVFGFEQSTRRSADRLLVITFVFAVCVAGAFSQDDDAVAGKVLDETSRSKIGKAEIITASNDFGFYIKMWLDGSRLRIIR